MIRKGQTKLAQLVAFIFLLDAASGSIACQQQRHPGRYLIPNGYVGWVKILFKVQDAPPLPIEDGCYVFKIPADGRLQTSSDIEFGVASDEYYYVSERTREALRSTGWDGGGMIWAGYNGRTENGNHEVTEIHEGFFVGTEEEYRKFGAGHEDKVGPIKAPPIKKG